jgi:hypothetical protein
VHSPALKITYTHQGKKRIADQWSIVKIKCKKTRFVEANRRVQGRAQKIETLIELNKQKTVIKPRKPLWTWVSRLACSTLVVAKGFFHKIRKDLIKAQPRGRATGSLAGRRIRAWAVNPIVALRQGVVVAVGGAVQGISRNREDVHHFIQKERLWSQQVQQALQPETQITRKDYHQFGTGRQNDSLEGGGDSGREEKFRAN